jgi:hypothetical protein
MTLHTWCRYLPHRPNQELGYGVVGKKEEVSKVLGQIVDLTHNWTQVLGRRTLLRLTLLLPPPPWKQSELLDIR